MSIEDVREFKAPDPDVPCGYRPSIAAVIPGRNADKTLWVISHIDVVPPGDLALWDHDPYTLVRDGDTIIGRGVEDNQQGIVSTLLAGQAIKDLGLTPEINLGMLFVADEETGSTFGLDYLVREHADLFGKDDLILVPDFGVPSSEMVEVAEKSMFWLKITVQGKQCHASTPHQGVNTLVPTADFILRIKELEDIFDAQNPIYDPPHSTFEPTKKEANVENVNTIPGRDVFYVDSRILPEYVRPGSARPDQGIRQRSGEEIRGDHRVRDPSCGKRPPRVRPWTARSCARPLPASGRCTATIPARWAWAAAPWPPFSAARGTTPWSGPPFTTTPTSPMNGRPSKTPSTMPRSLPTC